MLFVLIGILCESIAAAFGVMGILVAIVGRTAMKRGKEGVCSIQ